MCISYKKPPSQIKKIVTHIYNDFLRSQLRYVYLSQTNLHQFYS